MTGDKTCIDCHMGIAHELPDMEAAAMHSGMAVASGADEAGELRKFLVQAGHN